MEITKTRRKILEYINNNGGWRLKKIQQGLASNLDKELLDEALGFRSLCLFSNLSDKDLQRLWNNSNLEFAL